MEKEKSEGAIVSGERTLFEGLLFYFFYFWRHKTIIISFTLLAALGSVGFSLLSLWLLPERSPLPNYYRAYSVLIIGQDNGSDMSAMLTSLGIQVPIGHSELNYGELGITVLRSRPFVDEIIEKHNIIEKYEITDKIKSKSRRILLNNSDFSYSPRTGTLTISYEAIDPVFARDVVQSMVAKLQEWFQKWEGSSAQQELSVMKKKIDEVTVELSRLEKAIQDFQTKYGVLSVEQLAEAQVAMITDLQSQLLQKEVAIKNYSGFSTIEDQGLIQLKAERESLKDLIQQIEEGNGEGRKMPSKAELPALALEYSHLRMSHEIQMRIFQNLQEQYEVQKLTNNEISMFSVLEPAEIPDEKSRPSRSRICIIATVLGFLTSIVIALVVDAVHRLNSDPEKKKIIKGL